MKKYIPLILKLVAAVIMLQTLFFKFTAAQESVDLYTTLVGENEAIMRIGTGVIELIAAILLFIPKRAWFDDLRPKITYCRIQLCLHLYKLCRFKAASTSHKKPGATDLNCDGDHFI